MKLYAFYCSECDDIWTMPPFRDFPENCKRCGTEVESEVAEVDLGE